MKSKILTITVMFTLAITLMFGCGKNEGQKDKKVGKEVNNDKDFEKKKKEFQKKTGKALVKEYVKDKSGKATKEEYRKLLENSRYFESENFEWAVSVPDNFCDAEEIIKNAGGYVDRREAVYGKLYKSPYDYERLYTIVILNTNPFNHDERAYKAYEYFMKEEKLPHLRASMMNGLSDYLDKKEVMDYFDKASKDKDPIVRASARFVYKAEDKSNPQVTEIVKRLLEDDNKEVRAMGASVVGYLGNESLIPLLMEDLKKDGYEISGYVGNSLCHMWLDDASIKKAYEEYINKLKEEPRSEKNPGFAFIDACCRGHQDRAEFYKELEKKEYYNKDEMLGVLKEILMDENTMFLTKSTALKAIATYGSVEDLESVSDYIDKWDKDRNDELKEAYNDLVDSYGENLP